MMSAKRESSIMDADAMSSCPWWSVLCARAYATLSSTSLPIRPYLREATSSCAAAAAVPFSAATGSACQRADLFTDMHSSDAVLIVEEKRRHEKEAAGGQDWGTARRSG
jgi:hypothetical protein